MSESEDVFSDDDNYELALHKDESKWELREQLFECKKKGYESIFYKNIKNLKIFVGYLYENSILDEVIDAFAAYLAKNNDPEDSIDHIMNNRIVSAEEINKIFEK